jgi:hypothetical protein
MIHHGVKVFQVKRICIVQISVRSSVYYVPVLLRLVIMVTSLRQ